MAEHIYSFRRRRNFSKWLGIYTFSHAFTMFFTKINLYIFLRSEKKYCGWAYILITNYAQITISTPFKSLDRKPKLKNDFFTRKASQFEETFTLKNHKLHISILKILSHCPQTQYWQNNRCLKSSGHYVRKFMKTTTRTSVKGLFSA